MGMSWHLLRLLEHLPNLSMPGLDLQTLYFPSQSKLWTECIVQSLVAIVAHISFFTFYFLTHVTLNCAALMKTDGIKVIDLNTYTRARTLSYLSSLCSTLLHNLMKHHGYSVCIYSGLFVFAGVEFGWMTEVIPCERHFNHIRSTGKKSASLSWRTPCKTKKGHDASRHNWTGGVTGSRKWCGMERKSRRSRGKQWVRGFANC